MADQTCPKCNGSKTVPQMDEAAGGFIDVDCPLCTPTKTAQTPRDLGHLRSRFEAPAAVDNPVEEESRPDAPLPEGPAAEKLKGALTRMARRIVEKTVIPDEVSEKTARLCSSLGEQHSKAFQDFYHTEMLRIEAEPEPSEEPPPAAPEPSEEPPPAAPEPSEEPPPAAPETPEEPAEEPEPPASPEKPEEPPEPAEEPEPPAAPKTPEEPAAPPAPEPSTKPKKKRSRKKAKKE